MKRIVYYFLGLLLFLSCGRVGTNKSNNQAIASQIEIAEVKAEESSVPAAKVTQKCLDHIIDRHWFTSKAKGAGKFAQEITVNDLKEMIEITSSKGKLKANTNDRPGTIAEYNFGRTIGTTIDGYPASRLRVVIAPDGYVITAFPY